MYKLIKLEIKKFKLWKHWKGVLISNVGFIAFLGMIYGLELSEENVPFENFEMVILILGSIVRATFIIYASFLIVKLVIDEYKNKTIDIMFTYPVKRKKILAAKLMIVMAFTFFTVFLSNVLIGGLFVITEAAFDILPGEIGVDEIYNNLISTFFYSLATAGISLIPLLFGMPRKSAPATIVTAIFLVCLIGNTTDSFTVFSIIAVPISLALLGLFIGYLSIRNIEKVDVR
ncbi:ABC transporter permease [Ureibacillus sinduriensis]|uniref:ABC transporter permease n=1 Tax=Ureibacillus sinduriensis TaxID=561440 RepID=UPI000691F1F4|nr:ABC transporter permease [Ureibacillus sinduriensis]